MSRIGTVPAAAPVVAAAAAAAAAVPALVAARHAVFSGNDALSVIFSNFITQPKAIKDFFSMAFSNRASYIAAGSLLERYLLEDRINRDADPFIRARANIDSFLRHPEHVKREYLRYLTFNSIGRNYIFQEVLAGRYNDDPVSRILSGRLTAAEEAVMAIIDARLAAPGLDFGQRSYLQDLTLRAYIASGQLTIEQVLDDKYCYQVKAFGNEYVRAYIASGQLKVAQVLEDGYDAYIAFRSEHVRAYITSGQLKVAQVVRMHYVSVRAFDHKYVRDAIASEQLNMAQVLMISDYSESTFAHRYVQRSIDRNEITVAQVYLSWKMDFIFEKWIERRTTLEEKRSIIAKYLHKIILLCQSRAELMMLFREYQDFKYEGKVFVYKKTKYFVFLKEIMCDTSLFSLLARSSTSDTDALIIQAMQARRAELERTNPEERVDDAALRDFQVNPGFMASLFGSGSHGVPAAVSSSSAAAAAAAAAAPVSAAGVASSAVFGAAHGGAGGGGGGGAASGRAFGW